MRVTEIVEAIRHELARRDSNPHRAARDAGLPANAIRYLVEGREPKAGRLAEICDALGLEFYVGPPREPPMPWSESEKPTTRLERRGGPATRGPPLPDRETKGVINALPVMVLETPDGNGDGPEMATGCQWFRRDWMKRFALQEGSCLVTRIRDDRMQPTLPLGASIVVDMGRQERRPGLVFKVIVGNRRVVRRAHRTGDGRWWLTGDNPRCKAEPWPETAEIVGQVVWTARMLL